MIRKTLLSSLFVVLLCAQLMGQAAPPPPPPTKPPADVNVVNTPTVQLAGTSTVQVSGTTNVHVQNDSTTPVVVQDVSTPKRTPFQAQTGFPALPFIGDNPVVESIAVPAGKRLVIEHVSARAVLPFQPQSPFVYFSLTTTVAGITVDHSLNVPQIFICSSCTPTGGSLNVVSQETKFYADPGTTVQTVALGVGGSAESINIKFAISGYLEDAQ